MVVLFHGGLGKRRWVGVSLEEVLSPRHALESIG